MQSLLGRIARHPLRLAKNESEDRLTELFAAILEHPECDGLAVFVVLGWLKSALHDQRRVNGDQIRLFRDELAAGTWTLRVRTQLIVSADGRPRRPDLELVFEYPDRPPLVVWVEVKHGTGPSRNQLNDYVLAQQQAGLGSRGLVILVAPRSGYGWFAEQQMPDPVLRLTWQQTALLLTNYTTPSEVSAFLVAELCRYLREEGLMDPDRITPDTLSHSRITKKGLKP